MSDIAQQVRDLLTPYNPHTTDTAAGTGAKAEALLHDLLARPREPSSVARLQRWPIPHIRVVTVAATAAVAAAAVVAGVVTVAGNGPAQRAYAVTPSPLQLPAGSGIAGQTELLGLAAVAGSQPIGSAGPVRYVKIQGWYLNTAVSGGAVTSVLDPTVRQLWRTAAGRTEVHTTRDGRHSIDTVPVGAADVPTLSALSTDPSTLGGQLLGYPNLGQDNLGIPNAIETVERIRDLLDDQGRLPAPLASAVLRVLASDGLTYHGAMNDRLGRPAEAFTLDADYSGLPTRYMLLISPTTGQILDYEAVLTRDAGKLNVRIPAVTTYELYVDGRNVSAVGQL